MQQNVPGARPAPGGGRAPTPPGADDRHRLDPVGAVAWLLLAVGAFVAGFAVYELVGTMAAADVDQARLRAQLAEDWARPPATSSPATPTAKPPTKPTARPASAAARPRLGSGFALLRIDRIGVDQVIVEGADRVDLRHGPGHLPGSALPGQRGTMLVSGHRSTYGAPFFRLDELRGGDTVDVVTRDATYTYTVRESRVLGGSGRAWRLADEPAGGRAAGGVARLVLTTAHPRFAATRQLVVLADLTATAPGGFPAR